MQLIQHGRSFPAGRQRAYIDRLRGVPHDRCINRNLLRRFEQVRVKRVGKRAVPFDDRPSAIHAHLFYALAAVKLRKLGVRGIRPFPHHKIAYDRINGNRFNGYRLIQILYFCLFLHLLLFGFRREHHDVPRWRRIVRDDVLIGIKQPFERRLFCCRVYAVEDAVYLHRTVPGDICLPLHHHGPDKKGNDEQRRTCSRSGDQRALEANRFPLFSPVHAFFLLRLAVDGGKHFIKRQCARSFPCGLAQQFVYLFMAVHSASSFPKDSDNSSRARDNLERYVPPETRSASAASFCVRSAK